MITLGHQDSAFGHPGGFTICSVQAPALQVPSGYGAGFGKAGTGSLIYPICFLVFRFFWVDMGHDRSILHSGLFHVNRYL